MVTTRGTFFKVNGESERWGLKGWKPQVFAGASFVLVDQHGGVTKNAVMVNRPNGDTPPTMPMSVRLPCNARRRSFTS